MAANPVTQPTPPPVRPPTPPPVTPPTPPQADQQVQIQTVDSDEDVCVNLMGDQKFVYSGYGGNKKKKNNNKMKNKKMNNNMNAMESRNRLLQAENMNNNMGMGMGMGMGMNNNKKKKKNQSLDCTQISLRDQFCDRTYMGPSTKYQGKKLWYLCAKSCNVCDTQKYLHEVAAQKAYEEKKKK